LLACSCLADHIYFFLLNCWFRLVQCCSWCSSSWVATFALARRLGRCGLVVWVSQPRFHCNRRASARCGCNRPCGCHCTVSFDTRSWFSIAVPPSSGASGTVPRLGWCFGHYGISRAAACCSFHSLNSLSFPYLHIYFELMLMHSSSRCSLIHSTHSQRARAFRACRFRRST